MGDSHFTAILLLRRDAKSSFSEISLYSRGSIIPSSLRFCPVGCRGVRLPHSTGVNAWLESWAWSSTEISSKPCGGGFVPVGRWVGSINSDNGVVYERFRRGLNAYSGERSLIPIVDRNTSMGPLHSRGGFVISFSVKFVAFEITGDLWLCAIIHACRRALMVHSCDSTRREVRLQRSVHILWLAYGRAR